MNDDHDHKHEEMTALANKNLKDEMTKFSKLSNTDISYEKKIYFMNIKCLILRNKRHPIFF